MTSKYESVGEVLVLSLEGKLNSNNAAEVEADILRHVGQGANQLLFDMSGLDYISSAGLRVLLVAAKRIRQSAGAMVLCCVQHQIRDVLEISGFLNILSVADTREHALQRFQDG